MVPYSIQNIQTFPNFLRNYWCLPTIASAIKPGTIWIILYFRILRRCCTRRTILRFCSILSWEIFSDLQFSLILRIRIQKQNYILKTADIVCIVRNLNIHPFRNPTPLPNFTVFLFCRNVAVAYRNNSTRHCRTTISVYSWADRKNIFVIQTSVCFISYRAFGVSHTKLPLNFSSHNLLYTKSPILFPSYGIFRPLAFLPIKNDRR